MVDPPKYTESSQNLRRQYTKAVNELNNDPKVKNVGTTLNNFWKTDDETVLDDSWMELSDVHSDIVTKLGTLLRLKNKWCGEIDALTDDVERDNERDTFDKYMSEKDGEGRVKDYKEMNNRYDEILAEVQDALKQYSFRGSFLLQKADMAVRRANAKSARDMTQPVITPTPSYMNNGGDGNAGNGGAPTVTSTDSSQTAPQIQPTLTNVPPQMILPPTVAQQLQYPYNQLQYPSASQPPLNHQFTQQSDTRQVNPSHVFPRLPSIDLPKFNGDRSRWKVFWQRFNELVHTRSDLLDMDKFAHLRSCLEGPAAQMVEGYPQLGEHYQAVVDALFEVYNHEKSFRIQIKRKLESLRMTGKDPDSMSMYLNNIRAVLLQLSYVDEVETNQLLICEVLSKFPLNIVEHVNAKFGDDTTFTMKEMLKCVSDYLNFKRYNYSLIEDSRLNSFPPYRDKVSERNKSDRSNVSQQKQQYRSENHNQASSQDNSVPSSARKAQCPFCDRPHSNPFKCFTAKTIDDRTKIIREKSLCKKCLQSGHLESNCSAKCAKCKGTHHIAICQSAHEVFAVTVDKTPNRVRLMTTRVTIENPVTKKHVICDALLDSGSTTSMMSLSLAKDLGLDLSHTHRTVISGVNGEAPVRDYPIVKPMIVYGHNRKKKKLEFSAMVKSSPISASLSCEELESDDLKSIRRHYKNLNRIHNNRSFVPSILFGIKEYTAILGKKSTVLPSGYVLYKSILGPIIAGGSSLDTVTVNTMVDLFSPGTEIPDEQLTELKKFLAVEQTQTNVSTEKEHRSQLDDAVEKHFIDTIRYENGEYTVKYFLNENLSSLPDNFEMAKSRLKSLYRTLAKNPKHLEFYDSLLKDQLESGQIEVVDTLVTDNPVHYIAHQGIERPDKPTTPLRIVFDASAKKKGELSLNEIIHPGPNLNQEIPAILIRARSKPFLHVADVEKAFLQIRLDSSQRDLLRFLWLKDPMKAPTEGNIIVFRFTVTPFGVNQSPYILNRVIRYHLEKVGESNIPHEILSNIYVDNVIIASDSSDYSFYSESKTMFESMHMNLRDFVSNVSSFNQSIPESDRGDPNKQKLFGLKWNPETDRILVTLPSMSSNSVTKRSVLSYLASMYDPIGLLAPITFRMKLFVQHLWNEGYDWDQTLRDPDLKMWNALYDDCRGAKFDFPRFTPFDSDTVHLVLFCDASTKGKGAVVYVQNKGVGGNILMSRNSILPRDSSLTIPKLELDAMAQGFSLVLYICRALNKFLAVRNIVIHPYSDSTTVIHWLSQEKEYQLGPYVSARIRKIDEIASELEGLGVVVDDVKYVSTDENPADHITRGLSVNEYNASTWMFGPSWLKRDQSEWKGESITASNLINLKPPDESRLDSHRFSSLNDYINRVAYVRRFAYNCRARRRKEHPRTDNFLSVVERNEAYNSIIRSLQSRYVELESNDSRSKSLFLDDNQIWRRNTRMSNSCLPDTAKFPILLPKCNDHLITLIIRNVHERLFHAGINSTVNEMMMMYSMSSMRTCVKRVLLDCVQCRKSNNRPYRYSEHPNLPQSRVQPSLPFSHTGVDFIGPFLGKNSEKYYALLFTCLTVRLVHIEPVTNMDTVTVINAMKRFISRRGSPRSMLSDSAPTFKQCAKLVKPFDCSNDLVNTFMSRSGIDWKFTTPHSPWKGAVYERLIKDIKKAMFACVGKRKMNFDEFSTLVIETEAVLNCRPLTYVSSDRKEHSNEGRSIRPIDFILPNTFLGQSTVAHVVNDDDDYRIPSENRLADVVKRLSQNEAIIEKFWNVWQSAYLLSLRDRDNSSPLHNGQHSSRLPEVGEVVLVIDESGNTPRSSWLMAKILSIEGTTIKLRSSAGRVIERPPNLLIPLEIRSVEHDEGTSPDKTLTVHPMITRNRTRNVVQN